ncbi:hypothetical protein ONE63_002100 [Megalurothrips usitatus]|uniref:Superoxide dismutase [Cu-Zn] n=1 Tax=Megalurothrips usitatus TaxID=439358 RepID=A0AAV7XAF5_9NEOP|nr:hypothetical protein ONE63_002100 [Megalurothrips usitatus]
MQLIGNHASVVFFAISVVQKKIFVFFFSVLLATCRGLELTARFSESGLHGEIRFTADGNGTGAGTLVNTYLEAVGDQEVSPEAPDVWSWSIHEFPVDYSLLGGRCDGERLGRSVVELDAVLGRLTLPELATSEIVVPEAAAVSLTGPRGVWGRSLLLVNDDGRRACATITVSGRADERLAEARFNSPAVSGSVYFRWVGSHTRGAAVAEDAATHTDTLILTDLSRAPPPNATRSRAPVVVDHEWKIYVTDILDSESDKSRGNCNFLQLLFNPDATTVTLGDLSGRLGAVPVAQEPASARSVRRDPALDRLQADLGVGPGQGRNFYLVLLDPQHPDSFLACARIRLVPPVTAVATLLTAGARGRVSLSQRTRFDPTLVRYDVHLPTPTAATALRGLRVRELPPPPGRVWDRDNPCNHTGRTYDPEEKGEADANRGFRGQDQYAVGDLTSKLIPLLQDLQAVTFDLQAQLWDMYLPLYGPRSVVHRSLVLLMPNISDSSAPPSPWACAPFSRYVSDNGHKMAMLTAEAVFRYPLAGRVVFRQPRDDPFADTTIIVEPLLHSGGPANNSQDHRWMVHDLPPGKDYFNWTARCISAGQVFDPYHILPVNSSSTAPTLCDRDRPGLCRVGDLTTRHGTLAIAGRRLDAEALTRRLYTDRFLPLSGAASVLGRSLVLFDDNGPKARGERLACGKITSIFRRKAVVKNWFSNGKLATVSGKMEVFQQSEYDGTDVEVGLEGLDDVNAYEVHEAPVQEQLEFPCEDTTLDGLFAPPSFQTAVTPGTGTPDQHPLGDLGAKFGYLDNQTHLNVAYNDTTLPLFGPNAIIGRSVVISRKAKNRRWACASIERGYAPSEARELRAIASFHHPAGFAYGYIKMTQLIHSDNSQSETVIEVNLRHPGKHDRNITRNHNWAVYVNPVGVDAAVKVLNTRCTAAGYIWNPHFTQLADPRNDELYSQECSPETPLRCYTGDISGRIGPIDLGLSRKVFTDSNFPLEGKVSAMGRSIVILNKDFGPERFACANIEPDNDIVKYANIRKPPRFVVSQFIEDVREVMGVPEWMLTVDSRKTKPLYNGNCIQFLLHFKGPIALQLEQDFSRLMNTGKLASPTLYVPGYTVTTKRKSSVSYKLCGVTDPTEKKAKSDGILISLLSTRKSSSASRNLVNLSAIFITVIPLFINNFIMHF